MKKFILRISCAALVASLHLYLFAQPTTKTILTALAPKAPSQPVTETFFGKEVTDPYRNLENLSDTSVMNWYKAQAAYADEQLSKLPLRDKIYQEIKEVSDKFSYQIMPGPGLLPDYRQDKIFYVKAFRGEGTGKLYCKKKNDIKDILVFDPNEHQGPGIPKVISGFSANQDGSLVCVNITQGGNELGHVMVIDTKSRQVIDSVERVPKIVDWIDKDIFIYTQNRTSDVHDNRSKLYREAKEHVVGKHENDVVVLSYKNNPEIVGDSVQYPEVYIPHKNAKYIIADISTVDQFSNVFLSKFNSTLTGPRWYTFIKKEDRIIRYEILGDKAYGLSVKDNKKGKILVTSAEHPDWSEATVIAEAEKGSISGLNPFTITKNYVYYVESYGVDQTLYRVKQDGSQKQKIHLSVNGMAIPFSGHRAGGSGLKISVISYVQPTVIYDFDEAKNSVIRPGLWLTPKVKGVDNVEVEETHAPSYDGTMIPLTIIKPKGIKKDGTHKVILYGYGSYGFVEPPRFDPTLSILANHDIIKVIAHVRGGGEFGEEWRLGGFKSTKQNTWKDAIACAEYMIQEGYTTPSKMAIMGMSAGGILAGRSITERPDLFAVAIPEVGVMNTLRIEFSPNRGNVSEFGTIKNESDFKNLYEMDSYVHVKDGVRYPATMITGGMNDPRVILWQPGKFAARLQEASASGKPILFRIDMQGGHGNLASTKDQQWKLLADELAFLLSQTNTKNK